MPRLKPEAEELKIQCSKKIENNNYNRKNLKKIIDPIFGKDIPVVNVRKISKKLT